MNRLRVSVSAAQVLGFLVVVHLVWGLVRLPTRVFARRIDDVVTFRERGAPGWFLDTPHLRGADAIRWVLQNTAPESVVLWDGEPMGALEFAPTLLAPRLVVAVALCPPANEEHAGLPIARATIGERRGAVVLVASKHDVRVEVR